MPQAHVAEKQIEDAPEAWVIGCERAAKQICTHMYIHVCIYVCVCAYIYIYIYNYTYIYVYVSVLCVCASKFGRQRWPRYPWRILMLPWRQCDSAFCLSASQYGTDTVIPKIAPDPRSEQHSTSWILKARCHHVWMFVVPRSLPCQTLRFRYLWHEKIWYSNSDRTVSIV